ncbi:MAG: YaiI/YqxD family protein [Bacillota bacterium]|nr:YaiI/YqxD family protein [Bacillota bacterium]
MRILVDADACPVKGIIIRVAKQKDIPVIMICDTSHEINDAYSTVITVEKARDSVDIALINNAKAGDLVVTQDYGVAAMAIGKGLTALNQNGLIYSDKNIDRLLFERHLGQKVRRAGGRTSNARKRTREDDDKFERALLSLLEFQNSIESP